MMFWSFYFIGIYKLRWMVFINIWVKFNLLYIFCVMLLVFYGLYSFVYGLGILIVIGS